MSKTALIAVDVQRDFIDGSLGGEGRELVIPPLVKLTYRTDVTVASRDWHPYDHFSFADDPEFRDGSWPRHCVAGSEGARLAVPIRALADVIVDKARDRDVEAYSAFDGSIRYGKIDLKLDALLNALGVSSVIVGGLCTDYCVKATALDAVRLGYRTVVPLDACAGVAPDTSERAVAEMRSVGVEVVPPRPIEAVA